MRAPAVAALAVSGTSRVRFEASLANDSVPPADPPDWGLKVTLKAALWPAPRVTGRFNPLMANPDPETLA